MSGVTIIRRVSNLSRMIGESGGKTVLAALRGAEAETASLRDEGRVLLLEAIGVLEAALAEPKDDAWLEAIYSTSSAIIDICPPDLQALGKAAWSLCDLTDRQRKNGRLEVPAIAVHVNVIRTLSGDSDPRAAAPLLMGLEALLAREVAKGG
ncbi:hypothetical protein [Caulobacter sp. NIBR1757]|uniref:hypothetical protein n=1 Tax=Caulobacter sp. NIBR1757 TaxID=3016000 RepID=UPI0022F0ED05|nr:hypothetical protein [Caulobacter sp. NIBR1757]WGM40399.1 hypothetical protein AMEJIAPC_03344 [Caulobacter sp. NIBR1757]